MEFSREAVHEVELLADYLTQHSLYLATAESVTAGRIAAALGVLEGSGQIMERGYVVYSPDAKIKLLGVAPETINAFTLTSEEVALEMARGALVDSAANVSVATTGIAGGAPMDGKEPGTVCFAWAYILNGETHAFARTVQFIGDREAIIHQASKYALSQINDFHQRAMAGEGI